MSDFLAIAAVHGKVLHLIDWDRPCWIQAEDPYGDRLIPELNSMLTDALLFFSYKDFHMPQDLFAGQRGNKKVFEMKDSHQYQEADNARKFLRSRKEPSVLLAYFGNLDSHLIDDIARFKSRVLTARINEAQ